MCAKMASMTQSSAKCWDSFINSITSLNTALELDVLEVKQRSTQSMHIIIIIDHHHPHMRMVEVLKSWEDHNYIHIIIWYSHGPTQPNPNPNPWEWHFCVHIPELWVMSCQRSVQVLMTKCEVRQLFRQANTNKT